MKTHESDKIHQTVVVMETATMTPLSFWVCDVNNHDLAAIIRQELRAAQSQKQKTIRPANGKLCLAFNGEQLQRGQILQVEEEHVIVCLIDSGEIQARGWRF